MKITRVHLKDFHHFKDVNIDLTYPLGHPKAGEPLDKVCIIGQSSTGKTTLLKVIGGHTFTIGTLFKEYKKEDFKNVKVYKEFEGVEVSVQVEFNEETNKNLYVWGENRQQGKKVSSEKAQEIQRKFQENVKTHFIYFPADLHYEF